MSETRRIAMREVYHSRNTWGGIDTTYRMKCDVCGKYIMNPRRRGADCMPMAFLTCGEDEFTAACQGWSMDSSKNRHVCPKCMEEMAERGINPLE